MNVEITNPDGSKLFPVFDPAHQNEVIGFYQRLFWNRVIKGYKATLPSGDVIEIGDN